jgi:hypothetical protein
MKCARTPRLQRIRPQAVRSLRRMEPAAANPQRQRPTSNLPTVVRVYDRDRRQLASASSSACRPACPRRTDEGGVMERRIHQIPITAEPQRRVTFGASA